MFLCVIVWYSEYKTDIKDFITTRLHQQQQNTEHTHTLTLLRPTLSSPQFQWVVRIEEMAASEDP